MSARWDGGQFFLIKEVTGSERAEAYRQAAQVDPLLQAGQDRHRSGISCGVQGVKCTCGGKYRVRKH